MIKVKPKVKVEIIFVLGIVLLIAILTFIFKIHPLVQVLLIISFIMVDLLISVNYLWKKGANIDINRYQGDGTRDIPIIIENFDIDQQFPMIIGLKKYSIIQNVNTTYLEINKSENIEIKKSEFGILTIQNSKNINISNIKVHEHLIINKTREVSLESSELNTLFLKSTNNIQIGDCSIITLRKELNNDNLLITNKKEN